LNFEVCIGSYRYSRTFVVMASFSSIGVFEEPLIALPALITETSPFDTVILPTLPYNTDAAAREPIRNLKGYDDIDSAFGGKIKLSHCNTSSYSDFA
jgi:hypothetical protein